MGNNKNRNKKKNKSKNQNPNYTSLTQNSEVTTEVRSTSNAVQSDVSLDTKTKPADADELNQLPLSNQTQTTAIVENGSHSQEEDKMSRIIDEPLADESKEAKCETKEIKLEVGSGDADTNQDCGSLTNEVKLLDLDKPVLIENEVSKTCLPENDESVRVEEDDDDEEEPEPIEEEDTVDSGFGQTKDEPEYMKLQNRCESYFTWLPTKVSVSEAICVATNLEGRIPETHLHNLLRFDGVELITVSGAIAFLYIVAKELGKAEISISVCKKIMKICEENNFVDKENLVGCHYVISCLEKYLTSKVFLKIAPEFVETNEEIDALVLKMLAKAPEFGLLSNQAKACVLAMKVLFFGEMRFDHAIQEQIDTMKQVIELDKNNFLWHLYLYKLLRFSSTYRKYDANAGTHPSNMDSESDAINETIRLAPNDNINCMYALATFVLEKIKKHKFKSGPFRLRGYSFANMDEVADFVKVTTKRILEHKSLNVNMLCGLADFYTKMLSKIHDKDLAKDYIKMALAFNPKSSKANHRMAMFFLVEEKSLISAEKYCGNALKEDPRNFPALCELIQIYLANPTKNKEKLEALFAVRRTQSNDSTWSAKKSLQIQYLKSLFLFMIDKDPSRSIKIMISVENARPGLCFHNLGYQMRKFKWQQNLISFEKLIRELARAAGPSATAKQFLANRELLVQMKKTVEAIQVSEMQYEKIQSKREWDKQQKETWDAANAPRQSSSVVFVDGALQPCTDIRHRDKDKK